MNTLKQDILDISRQNNTHSLSVWFEQALNGLINDKWFPDQDTLVTMNEKIINDLTQYREQANIHTVVLGMSGGVDSALTAALFRNAGWKVIGVTMPIHQDPAETARGQNTIDALGIHGMNLDLSNAYDHMLEQIHNVDPDIYSDDQATRIRRGNIRARLRMVTLYNLAAAHSGLVASTDNFSELAAGFWTLHGDVGDLSPIQSLSKSWEVPMLAMMNGVPEETWRAKPTDGLGVDDGDEAQFGFTYLELDIMLKSVGEQLLTGDMSMDEIKDKLSFGDDNYALNVFNNAMKRMGSTWFKRFNPINLQHPNDVSRYDLINTIDNNWFVPEVIK